MRKTIIFAISMIVIAITGCASQQQAPEPTEIYQDYWTKVRDQVDAVAETSNTECIISCYDTTSWDEPDIDEPLLADTNYRFGLNIPDEALPKGLKVVINVTYPEEVRAGESGTIQMEAKDEHGHVWHGQYDFVAGEDLSFAHGDVFSDISEIGGDGIFCVGDYNRGVVVALYSSAKAMDNYDEIIADNFAARTGACPTALVYYHLEPKKGSAL